MAIVGAWVATAIGATGAAAALVSAGVQMAISYAIQKVTQPKGPRPEDVQTEIKSSKAARIRHLGKVKVSGASMFWDWQKIDGKRTLFKLLAVGQGGISAIERFWLNDKPCDLAADGFTVTNPPYQDGIARLRWLKGRDEASVGGDYPTLRAAFSEWTIDHKLSWIGTILGEFDAVKAEDIQDTYPGGDPEISAVILGDKCHNPISGIAGWSQNCAVHLRDVLTHPTYGCMSGADLDVESWQQAIADCDDDLPAAGGGTVKRYWGGGSYALTEPVKDVAQRILDACGGQLFLTSEGTLGLRVAKWRAPTHTITADKATRISIRRGTGEMERITTLQPKFTSPDLGYQATDADAWDDAAALAEVGETVPKELDVPWVQHHGQARRLAKIKIAKLNPKWTATIRLRWWGLLLIDQEMVRLNLPHLGIVNEPFWIDGWGLDSEAEDGPVVVNLIHASQSSLSWAAPEEGAAPAVPGSVSNGYTPSPLSISSVTVVTDDGPPFIRLRVEGFDPLQGGAGIYRPQGSTIWTAMLEERVFSSSGAKWFRTGPLEDRRQYDLQVRTTGGLFPEKVGGMAEVTGVEVFANSTPPDDPVIVTSSGAAGGAVSVTFRPDVGANYHRTGLYRAAPGAVFSTAALIKWDYSTAAEVTMTAAVPSAGARFWLRSENGSGVPSPTAVFIGEFI